MKETQIIILAAGYATRLYPLTLTYPKPLLKIAGKPIIEHLLDRLAPIRNLGKINIIINEKFADKFEEWLDGYDEIKKSKIELINDGSVDETDKLGAIGDLHLAIKMKGIANDIIVVAGDNLFDVSLEKFGDYCGKKNSPVLGVYDVGNLEAIKRFSSITIGKDRRIKYFEEKPANPKSTLTGIALYHYPKSTLPLIDQYVTEGNNPDQPGRLVQWLYTRKPFYTWKVPGIWYDIGSKETLEEANRVFQKNQKNIQL